MSAVAGSISRQVLLLCGLRVDRRVMCPGEVSTFDGSPIFDAQTELIGGQSEPPDGTYTQLAAGSANCALSTESRIECWGDWGHDPNMDDIGEFPPEASQAEVYR